MDKRVSGFKIIITIILVLLLGRAAQLQLVMGEYYYQLSEGNRISHRPINAPRGRIIDAEGNILVSNTLSYNLYLLPNEVSPDYTIERLLKKLCDLTTLELDLLKENYQQNATSTLSKPIILKRNISKENVVIIEENNDDLPGILVKESSRRDYVYHDLAAHVLGYVGEISLSELKELSNKGLDYQGGDMVGKTGLEKEYEIFLKGEDGIERLEVNSRGKKVKSLGIKPPVNGDDLILNLSMDLQQFTEKVLREHFSNLQKVAADDPDLHIPTGGAAIVMDPNTGAIKAMVSLPQYDLNLFSKEYNKLINDPFRPLINRATQAAVPPGSIFKLVTGTAAIEYLGVDENTMFVDKDGVFRLGEYEFRNWHWGGEGELSFIRAIARSNNIVFYRLGYDLYKKYGGYKLAETAKIYGLGSKTGIDLPGEEAGLVPDPEWKKESKKTIWYPGDSVNLSIGQFALKTTPLQLIDMISAIANGGTLYKPQLVDKIVGPDGEEVIDFKPEVRRYLPFEKETYRILRKGMVEVATAVYPNGERGTAARVFKDFPVKVAGKTGTAQTGSTGPNHGWFAGFAPVDDPEIAVIVFLENGNMSKYALPVAAAIFKHYFGLDNNDTGQEISETSNHEGETNQLFKFFKEVFSGSN